MKNFSTVIWILLIGLTCVTYTSPMYGLAAGTVVLLTLSIALAKAQLVADFYMGLARVGGFWRFVVIGYLLVVGAGIAGAFLL